MNNINDKIKAFLDYNGEDTIRSRGFAGRETLGKNIAVLKLSTFRVFTVIGPAVCDVIGSITNMTSNALKFSLMSLLC